MSFITKDKILNLTPPEPLNRGAAKKHNKPLYRQTIINKTRGRARERAKVWFWPLKSQ